VKRQLFYSTVLALAPALVAAQAITRPIPDDARLGTMSHVIETTMSVDGQRMKLAPGASIRSQQNLVIVPSALPPGSLVKYQVDKAGEITGAWVLTAEEAAKGGGAGAAGQGSYVEPPGTPIDRVLGNEAPQTGYGPPPAPKKP